MGPYNHGLILPLVDPNIGVFDGHQYPCLGAHEVGWTDFQERRTHLAGLAVSMSLLKTMFLTQR